MDRYEYNLKAGQIQKFIENDEFDAACKIAETIDFEKVKDSALIVSVAQAYENLLQYSEAKELLLIAYERATLGRQLAYKLCLLSIKTKEYDDAEAFYKEFCKMAPNDISQYILRYEIEKADGTPVIKLIEILEAYLEEDMDEKWAYELAKLYHKAGMISKCISECDMIILWFSDGVYVDKAKELRMMYTVTNPVEVAPKLDTYEDNEQPLLEEDASTETRDNEEKEDIAVNNDEAEDYNNDEVQADNEEQYQETENIKEDEYYSADGEDYINEYVEIPIDQITTVKPEEQIEYNDYAKQAAEIEYPDDEIVDMVDANQIHIKEVGVGLYDTINIQAELAKSMDDILSVNYDDNGDKTDKISDTIRIDKFVNENSELQVVDEEQQVVEEQKIIEEEKPEAPIEEKQEASIEEKQETIIEEGVNDDQIQGQMSIEDMLMSFEDEAYDTKEKNKLVVNVDVREENMKEIIGNESKQEGEQEAVEDSTSAESTISDNETSIEEEIIDAEEKEVEEANAVETEKIADKNETATQETQDVCEEEESDTKEDEEKCDENAVEIFEKAMQIAKQAVADKNYEIEDDFEGEFAKEFLSKDKDKNEDKPENEVADEVDNDIDGEDDKEAIDGETKEENNDKPMDEEISDEEVEEDWDDEVEDKEAADEETAEEATEESDLKDQIKNTINEIDKAVNEENKTTIKENERSILSEERKKFFESFTSCEGLEENVLKVVDSLVTDFDEEGTSKTGNILILGDQKRGKTALGLDILKEINCRRNRRGRKIAKANAAILNAKGIDKSMQKLLGTDLIIEKASNMTPFTVKELINAMNGYTQGMIVILEDDKSAIERMIEMNTELNKLFNHVIEITETDINEWVKYALEYAETQGYTVDEMGTLGLYAKIDEIYARVEKITNEKVEEVMNNAIRNSRHRGIGARIGGLFKAKEKNMSQLHEADFLK